jgi:hypothetical protein
MYLITVSVLKQRGKSADSNFQFIGAERSLIKEKVVKLYNSLRKYFFSEI